MTTLNGFQQNSVLVAIGGAEDKASDAAILKRVLSLAPEEHKSVGVITTASGMPDQVFDAYYQVFTRLGADQVCKIDIRERRAADSAEIVTTIRRCGVIFFTGGDQMRLTTTLGASRALGAIREQWQAGAVVAGTSAGAACMSSTMIYGGPAVDSLRKGTVNMSAGLGFAQGMIFDSHFLERGRFTRLMEVGATNPEYVGVGLGEDAGVIVRGGTLLEAVGSGHVVIMDSSRMAGSNVADIVNGEAVAVENLIMHALINGYGYSVSERRTIHPAEMAQEIRKLKVEGRCENSRTQSASRA